MISTYQSFIYKFKENEKLKMLAQQQLSDARCNGQSLQVLIVRPIQRIPSMLLLFK